MEAPKSEAEAVEQMKPTDGEALRRVGQKWLERIQAAQKREHYWREEANKATLAYTGEDGPDDTSNRLAFNILHSNVETIIPAVYNSTPAPDIRRRFRDDDPVAKATAQILERAISVQIDDGALDAEIEAAAQDSYVAGRGIWRVRFEDENGFQRISFEAVSWRDYAEGPAKRWRDVPWIAFRLALTKEGSDGIADPAILQAQTQAPDYKYEGEARDDVEVWEVWERASACIYFVRASDGVLLKKVKDPLNLSGFFPIPEPVQPVTITGRRMPVNPYSVYRELAEELDTLTKRIRGISKGLKVRGATLSGEIAQDIEQWASSGDNEIVAVRGVEAFAQAGGLDKAISWWPIEQAVNVLRELVAQREQTKQAIYEITGISDIVRGASDSSETATAQQIKTQWGSLRIKKMQRDIERCVRETFNMMAELIATKFTPETLQQISGIEVTPEIIELLSSPVQRVYRVDVESDSTVRGDVGRMQGEMNSFMQGVAQYIQAVGQAVMAGQIPKDVAMEFLASFARTFKLGRQAEDALDRWLEEARNNQGQPAPPSPEQQAQMQAQQMAMQAEVETKAHGARKAKADADKAEFELARMQVELMAPPPVEPPPMPEPQPDPEIEMDRELRKARGLKEIEYEFATRQRQDEAAAGQAKAEDDDAKESRAFEAIAQALTQNGEAIREGLTALAEKIGAPPNV